MMTVAHTDCIDHPDDGDRKRPQRTDFYHAVRTLHRIVTGAIAGGVAAIVVSSLAAACVLLITRSEIIQRVYENAGQAIVIAVGAVIGAVIGWVEGARAK